MEFRLLGPPQVLAADGQALPIHGVKLRGLMVLLALETGRVVPSEGLVDALYGEDPPPTVDNSLQQLVSKLRRILGPAAVATRAPGYCLTAAADDVDVHQFERLSRSARTSAAAGQFASAARTMAEALALWRGEAFAGLEFTGGVAGLRTRLSELREAAVEDRIDWELALGRHSELVAELEAMVAAAPLRERRWGQLMTALYRCGRQGGALAAYGQLRGTLAEELGVEPSPALRRLQAAVLAHDPELAPMPPAAVEPLWPAPRLPAPRRTGHARRPRTACLGRETELSRLAELAARPCLITLVGPGGVGKTRLAWEVADLLQRRLRDGVRWAELAPVTAGGVAATVARAAGYEDATLAGDLFAGLGQFLAGRETALILDSCEHLIDEVAEFVADLLDAVPGLWLVATSREGLAVEGETLFPVQPLALPAAVALFLERARAEGVPLQEQEVIADICRRLDGLPLAVELAAARTRHLGIGEIARRIDQRFELLTGGPRTAEARQRTLRAVIDWSYALLEPAERDLFGRLSLFENGFTAAGAEAVAAEPADAFGLLTRLVDKSLVVVAPALDVGETRYRLLETLREYGREQLTAPDAHALFRRHFVELAATAEEGLLSRDFRRWQLRLELELPNLRAAWRSALTAGERDDALRIAMALWWFWGSTDRHQEGRQLVEEALSAAGPPMDRQVRAMSMTVLGYLAGQQLDLNTARRAGAEAVALSRDLRDEVALATAEQSYGLTLEAAGEHERSAALLASARAVWDARHLHQQVSFNDVITAVRALVTGDLELLDRTSREILCRSQLTGYDVHLCWGHLLRARLAEARDDLATAERECREALAAARRLKLAHFVSFTLTQLGRVLAGSGGAEGLLAEAITVADQAGAGWFGALARVELQWSAAMPETSPEPRSCWARYGDGAAVRQQGLAASPSSAGWEAIRSLWQRPQAALSADQGDPPSCFRRMPSVAGCQTGSALLCRAGPPLARRRP